jgi:NAD+ synthase
MYSSKSSVDDAVELCNKFDMQYEIIKIDSFIDSYKSLDFTKNSNNLRVGNFSARIRMSILFDISQKLNAMVVGTSNKSELMLGYGTWYGDLASSLNPIGDIYKSDIFLFAKYLGVTKNIVEKTPSADLWDGQSDEDELGFSYAKIDAVLVDFVERRVDKKQLLKKHDDKLVEMVLDKIFKNQFKRKTPIIAKTTNRTIGHDFLYARDIKA